MPTWESVFAALGGASFFWKLVDLYRDRTNVVIVELDIDRNQDNESLVTLIDNRGKHAVWVKPRAWIRGRPLWNVKHSGMWIRPKLLTPIFLSGTRKIDGLDTQILRWKLTKDNDWSEPETALDDWGKLDFVRWPRTTLRLEGTWRSVELRSSEYGQEKKGRVAYWWGYLCCYLRDRSRREKVLEDESDDS